MKRLGSVSINALDPRDRSGEGLKAAVTEDTTLFGPMQASQALRNGAQEPPRHRLQLCAFLTASVIVLLLVSYWLAGSSSAQAQLVIWRDAVVVWADAYPETVAIVAAVSIASWIVCLIPSTPIELTMAFAFGLGPGFAIVYTGKVAGCMLSYALGRTVCHRCTDRLLQEHELLLALRLAVLRSPWRLCLLARAAYIPIAVKNYGFAALGTPVLPYTGSLLVLETYNTFEVVYIGAALRTLGETQPSSWHQTAASVFAAACLVGLGAYGAVTTRRALEEMRSSKGAVESIGDGTDGKLLSNKWDGQRLHVRQPDESPTSSGYFNYGSRTEFGAGRVAPLV